jgi:hypothetical protein
LCCTSICSKRSASPEPRRRPALDGKPCALAANACADVRDWRATSDLPSSAERVGSSRFAEPTEARAGKVRGATRGRDVRRTTGDAPRSNAPLDFRGGFCRRRPSLLAARAPPPAGQPPSRARLVLAQRGPTPGPTPAGTLQLGQIKPAIGAGGTKQAPDRAPSAPPTAPREPSDLQDPSSQGAENSAPLGSLKPACTLRARQGLPQRGPYPGPHAAADPPAWPDRAYVGAGGTNQALSAPRPHPRSRPQNHPIGMTFPGQGTETALL